MLQADPREEIGNFPKEWRSLRCPFPNVCSAGLRTAVAINDFCPGLLFREQLSSRGQNHRRSRDADDRDGASDTAVGPGGDLEGHHPTMASSVCECLHFFACRGRYSESAHSSIEEWTFWRKGTVQRKRLHPKPPIPPV